MSRVVAWMYTHNRVRTFLRPVAFCALLVIGGVPTAALVCELACTAPTGHPGHQDSGRGSHHDHSSAFAHESTAAAAAASIVSPPAICNHDITGAPVRTSTTITLLAPVGIAVATFGSTAERRPDMNTVRDVAGGPPGARCAPLSLRI